MITTTMHLKTGESFDLDIGAKPDTTAAEAIRDLSRNAPAAEGNLRAETTDGRWLLVPMTNVAFVEFYRG